MIICCYYYDYYIRQRFFFICSFLKLLIYKMVPVITSQSVKCKTRINSVCFIPYQYYLYILVQFNMNKTGLSIKQQLSAYNKIKPHV